MLGVLGGAAAVFVGYATNRLLMAAIPTLPAGEMFRIDLALDFRGVLYTCSLALVTALLFGFLPALRSSPRDLAPVLKGTNITGGRMRLRLAMLAGQVALSLALLLTAGLFARLIVRFHNVDPGFASVNRLYAPAFLPASKFTPVSGRIFYAQTLSRLRALPGVWSASLTHDCRCMQQVLRGPAWRVKEIIPHQPPPRRSIKAFSTRCEFLCSKGATLRAQTPRRRRRSPS